MLTAVEAEPRWATFWLSCSVADGRGDALSDLDAALGWEPDGLPEDPLVLSVIRSAGSVQDCLAHRLPGWTIDHRRFAVEYADGLQLDLVVLPAAQRSYLVPGEVVLHDPDGLLVPTGPLDPVSAETAAEWLFLGWWALSDVAKYAARESWFEAAERLSDVRLAACRLWAVAAGARHPQFGLGQLLDLPQTDRDEPGSGRLETDARLPGRLPAGLESLYALPSRTSVLLALQAAPAVLEEARRAAGTAGLATPALAAHVRARLRQVARGR